MSITLSAKTEKETAFEKVEAYIISLGFKISDKDSKRPWGGFLVIEESQSLKFISEFFDSADKEGIPRDS